jgi:ATP-dependent protease ClpP protease subunit
VVVHLAGVLVHLEGIIVLLAGQPDVAQVDIALWHLHKALGLAGGPDHFIKHLQQTRESRAFKTSSSRHRHWQSRRREAVLAATRQTLHIISCKQATAAILCNTVAEQTQQAASIRPVTSHA